MTPQARVEAQLDAVQALADRLLADIDAGRGITAEDVAGFQRLLGRLPRRTPHIPPRRFAELDAALLDIVRASQVHLPRQRAGSAPVPRRGAVPRAGREDSRVTKLRARVETYEKNVAAGRSVLTCDLVNLDNDLRVLRSGRLRTPDDRRQVEALVPRVRKLVRAGPQSRASSARGRSSAGTGFWAYPSMGARPLEAGQMRHGPRTSNKGRPARSAWSCAGGLPTLGRR